MLGDVIGPKIKVNRAKTHLKELRTETKKYLRRDPIGVHEIEDGLGGLVYKVRINSPVPVEWSAIVGDIIHNLRSALDYMAWQLVLENGALPGRETYFPIGQEKRGYGKQLRNSLKGASQKAKSFVRRLKPYSGGNIILSQLHALDVCDKHRLMLIVGSSHKRSLITPKFEADWLPKGFKFPTIALGNADTQFPLEDGDIVLRMDANARKGKSILEHGLEIELAFGDVSEVKGMSLVPTLEDMIRHVERIVDISSRRLFKTSQA